MIGVAGLLVAGVILKNPLLFAAPLIYMISRINRDLFLISFAAYCIALGYSIEVKTLYDLSDIPIMLSIAISAILMLDEALAGRKPDRNGFVLLAPLLAGVLVREALLPVVVLATIMNFHHGATRKGVVVVVASLLVAVAGFTALKDYLSLAGAYSTQVSLLSALTILSVLPFWMLYRSDDVGWVEFGFRKD